MRFEYNLYSTAAGHVQFQFCPFAKLPTAQHVYAAALQQHANVHAHVASPIFTVGQSVLEGVDRGKAFLSQLMGGRGECRLALVDIMVRNCTAYLNIVEFVLMCH